MMNESIDFKEKIKHVERLLYKEEYTDSATRCMIVVELALRHIVREYLDRVDESTRCRVQESIRKRDKSGEGIDRLTMGQVVHVVRESRFLDAAARVLEKDLNSFQIIDLNKLTKLRNKFTHHEQEVSRTEAEFLLHCLKVILEVFEIKHLSQSPQLASDLETHTAAKELDRPPDEKIPIAKKRLRPGRILERKWLIVAVISAVLALLFIPFIPPKNKIAEIQQFRLEIATLQIDYEQIKNIPHHPQTSEIVEHAAEVGRKLLRIDDRDLLLDGKILKYQNAALAFFIAASMEYNSVTVSYTTPDYMTIKNFVNQAIDSGQKGIQLIKEVERQNNEGDESGQRLFDWIESEDIKKQITYVLAVAFAIQFQIGDAPDTALQQVEKLLNSSSIPSWCEYLRNYPPEEDPHLKEVLKHIHYRCQ